MKKTFQHFRCLFYCLPSARRRIYFFRSDLHWTQRGAYYEFVRSVGLTPTPIEEFEVKTLKENFIGTMYGYTKDERVKDYYDTVEAYLPQKACTMTIYNKTGLLPYTIPALWDPLRAIQHLLQATILIWSSTCPKMTRANLFDNKGFLR